MPYQRSPLSAHGSRTSSRRIPGFYNERQGTANILRQQATSYRRQLDIASRERDIARSEVQQLQSSIHTLYGMLEGAQGEKAQAKDTANENYRIAMRLNSEIRELEKESEIQVRKLEECMAELRRMQLGSFQQAQTLWAPEEDRTIRELVTSLYKSVRTWASTYCVGSFSNAPWADERNLMHLIEDMKEATAISSVHELTEFGHLFLILAALLSEHLHDYIFNNPFFAFNDPEDKGPNHGCGDILNKFLSSIPEEHQPEAQKWRAQSLRLLFPHPQDTQPGRTISTQGIPAKNLAKICEDIVKYFLCGAAAVLLRELDEVEEEARHIELHGIVVEASNLYARVQTQSASFVWQPSSTLLRKPFSIASTHMKPDRYHRLEHEEDPSHDGKPVLIVLSPVIEIRGDCGGSNVQISRILAKASVYLDEKPVPEVKQEGAAVISP